MRKKTSARKRRAAREPSEAQLAALQQSTTARRLATVERLRTAIDALKAKKREISVQTIYDECGLGYAAIHRNPEALALFRANSTHLVAEKKRRTRKLLRLEAYYDQKRRHMLHWRKSTIYFKLKN